MNQDVSIFCRNRDSNRDHQSVSNRYQTLSLISLDLYSGNQSHNELGIRLACPLIIELGEYFLSESRTDVQAQVDLLHPWLSCCMLNTKRRLPHVRRSMSESFQTTNVCSCDPCLVLWVMLQSYMCTVPVESPTR